MTKFRLVVQIALMSCLSSAGLAVGQDKGSIGGTVVDQNGAQVGGARVNASRMGGRVRGTAIRYVETDAQGHFLLTNLDWGKYKVFAKKEDAGYPEMAFSFYSDDLCPVVAITPWSPMGEVRIQLSPKAGLIVGSVKNAASGAPLNANFKLTRAAAPDKWLSTSLPASYRILLPSSTDVLLEVSAPGFNTWASPNPMRLQPGEERHLDVLLEPSHDVNLHPSRFLILDGYVGWLLLNYDVKGASAVPMENSINIFKFPINGALDTSSPGPQRGAEDEYFYYSSDGSLHEIPADYLFRP